MTIQPNQLPDEPEALKRIIATMAQDVITVQAEIAKLRFPVARYQRAVFWRASEKLARGPARVGNRSAENRLVAASPTVGAILESAAKAKKPARRALPIILPR